LVALKRYVGWELLRAFALSLGVFTLAVYFANSIQYIHRGLDLIHLAKLTPLVVGSILSYSLPLSVLTACVICYGRLAADNEFLGATASGIHPFFLLGPSMWLGVGAAVVALGLQMGVVPESRYRISMARKEVLSKISYRLLNVGQNVFHVPGGAIYCEGYSGGKLLNAVVIRNEGPDISMVFQAKEAEARFDESEGAIIYELRDGVYSVFKEQEAEDGEMGGSQRAVISATFGVFDQRLDFPGASRGRKIKELGPRGLMGKGGEGGAEGHKARGELHSRLALGLAPLAFILVGGPLGLFTRRGDRLSGLFLGLALAAKLSVMPVGPALWLANAVLAIIGAFLCRRVLRG